MELNQLESSCPARYTYGSIPCITRCETTFQPSRRVAGHNKTVTTIGETGPADRGLQQPGILVQLPLEEELRRVFFDRSGFERLHRHWGIQHTDAVNANVPVQESLFQHRQPPFWYMSRCDTSSYSQCAPSIPCPTATYKSHGVFACISGRPAGLLT